MLVLIIVALLMIFFTWKNHRLKKWEAEQRKIQKAKEKAKEEYDSLEKNVLCEDGINRVYINWMGGVIKEEIIRVTGHSPPPKRIEGIDPESYQRALAAVNQIIKTDEGFHEVSGKILSELTIHFNIRSISIPTSEELGYREIETVHFEKSKWFSENGALLSQKEIIDFDVEYKHKKRREGHRVNHSFRPIITIHEINGYYFSEFIGSLRTFNGRINRFEVKDGIAIEQLNET
jgi:hypothetical protein